LQKKGGKTLDMNFKNALENDRTIKRKDKETGCLSLSPYQ
jgi:hypothetical protein